MEKSLSNMLRWGRNALIAGIISTGMFMSPGYKLAANEPDDTLIDLLFRGAKIKNPQQKEAGEFLKRILKDGSERQRELDDKKEIIDAIEKGKQEKEKNYTQEKEKNYIEAEKIKENAFVCNYWVDGNKNNIPEVNEVYGLGKKVFDLDKEIFEVCFSHNKAGKVIFKSLNEKGEVIGESVYNNCPGIKEEWKAKRYVTGMDSPTTESDFIDKLNLAGSGKYKITVEFRPTDAYEKYIFKQFDVEIVK